MKRRILLSFSARLAAFFLIAALADPAFAAFGSRKKEKKKGPAIVGFLPDYRTAVIDQIPFEYLTDVIYFSIAPQWNGELDLSHLNRSALRSVVGKAKRKNVDIYICVGGWNRSGTFSAMAGNSAARHRFAWDLAEFCKRNRLRGADIDWEHPKTSTDVRNYNLLLVDLSAKFREKKLKLTVSVPGRGKQLRAHTFSLLDRVHVMAYDHAGPHSTYEHAIGDLRFWMEQGASKEQLILGVPFYGRNDRREPLAFGALIQGQEIDPTTDSINGFHFNNAVTLRRKTRLAVEGGFGGVMVWELSQDAPGEKSLLKAIHETANKAPEKTKPTGAKAK